jgi:Fe-S cluster biogenesis protein NfuA
MGGRCEILAVDPVTGVVDLKFRGAAKVQQGVELALLDVPLLNKVNFLMGDD